MKLVRVVVTLVAAGVVMMPSAPAQATVGVAGSPLVIAPSLATHFKNCTAMNKVYPHGVGRSHAVDKTSGHRVTNFKHSTSLYNKIVAHRRSLDRDHDGIACERA